MSAQTQNAPAPTGRTKVYLRVKEFDRLTGARGWTTDLACAQEMKVHHTTVGRVRKGGRAGGEFIGAALEALRVPFEAIFERRAN